MEMLYGRKSLLDLETKVLLLKMIFGIGLPKTWPIPTNLFAIVAVQEVTVQIEDALRKLRPVIHMLVAVQYGKDSDELASMGLKKTSEYVSGTIPEGRESLGVPDINIGNLRDFSEKGG
jgi:hypothetical protein